MNNHTLPEEKATPEIRLKVVREVFGKTSTLGKLYINGVFFAHTLEDKCRNLNGDARKKVKSQTCIDEGVYGVTVTVSNRFKKPLPLLLNVPCFEAIRIHGGNTEADTEGCILIGAESDGASRIWDCKGKVQQLVDKLTGLKGVTINISSATAATAIA
jgi:hypothetical protein